MASSLDETEVTEVTDEKQVEECYDHSDKLKVAHFLTSTFHVVLNILSYLNARQLNSASRVCKLWSKAAKTLKGRRRTRAWTFLQMSDEKEEEGEQKIVTATKHFLQGLYTEPKVIFMFCSTEFNEEAVKIQLPNKNQRQKTKTYTSFGDFVSSLIPESCQLVALSTSGIVGTSSDLKQTYESETDHSVAFLCLPHYHGFSVVTNTLDETDFGLDKLSSEIGIKGMIPDNTNCKALLNFISEPDVPRSFVLDLKKDFENAVLAGGMVDSLVPLDCAEGYPAALHVALCGENVDVGCVVIRETVHKKSKAEEIIKELKSYNLSEENSFAFMFACVGRGEGIWGEGNVETSLFRKHFPKTPIIGFFGNGEIGMDHVTTASLNTELQPEPFSKKSKKSTKLFHSFTTIMVLVSLK